MKTVPSSKIYLALSRIKNAGRGIFAAVDIRKDELIEACPIILVNENEVPKVRKTILMDYYFMWGGNKKKHKAGICLGFGSLYNHSYSPNATYKKILSKELIKFVAIKDIKKNEEITVNYNYGNPDDKSKLWTDSIPAAE